MRTKHFLQIADFTLDDYEYVIQRGHIIKRKFKNYETHHPLIDRTLVMVEHDMGVVFELADRISVLVNGEIVASDTPERIRANEIVRAAYLGTTDA